MSDNHSTDNKELKVIDKPTHSTAPDTVVHLNVNELKEDNLHYLPRNFSDLNTVIDIKNRCNTEIAHRKNLNNQRSDTMYEFIGLSKFALALFGPIIASCGAHALASHVFNINTDSLGFVLCVIFFVYIPTFALFSWSMTKYGKDETPKAALSRADKKTFKQIEFVADNPNHTKRIYSALRDAAITPELTHAYDSYMDLKVFLAANEDAISTELYKKYNAKLTQRRNALGKELDTALDIGRTQRKELQQFNNHTATVMQNMRDNDALRAMPLEEP